MKVATVCSGIGSPEQALVNLGIEHEIAFACEIDKYARQTYLANFDPKLMLSDMTKETWEGKEFYADLFIGGIPCQAFSLAGKRLGELDPRGLLFYDFYRYVQVQQPKYFIIENVKGLLSDDNGKTFRNWIQLLGRSENTHVNMFNHPDSLEYNLHWKVLNSKDFGVPQNRERVFIVGIRKDLDNAFRFPIGERLKLRLKDVLEENVDEKYYLSEKFLNAVINHSDRHQEKGNGFKFEPTEGDCIASSITTKAGQRTTDNYIKVKEATKRGYAVAKDGDSINLSNPNSETRRGRVGDQIANTLDTACNQAVVVGQTTNDRISGWYENENVIGAHRIDSKRSTVSEHVYHKEGGVCTTIQTAHVPKLVEFKISVIGNLYPSEHEAGNIYDKEGLSPTVKCNGPRPNAKNISPKVVTNHRIRRLTPLECFRLQGFPDEYIKPCSDSQTYKQAGNSITVNVMQAIIKNLLL